MIYAILVAVGLLLGITAILFGFGGGFAVVPVVYHLFPAYGLVSAADAHYAMQIGVATSTAVMIVGTIYATLKHHREGNIDWSSVFPMAAYIAVGAAIGAYAAAPMPRRSCRAMCCASCSSSTSRASSPTACCARASSRTRLAITSTSWAV